MRLIDIHSLTLEEFERPPDYAILSHRWGDGEISLRSFYDQSERNKQGFQKIQGFCSIVEQAELSVPAWENLGYVWVDTCCIDKTSSAELSEAINSMFRWYTEARACCVYLDDVDNLDELAQSKWFTRGWTLQELIAPLNVDFYNKSWQHLGTKESLTQELTKITGIPENILQNPSALFDVTIAQRMAWAASRVTTRVEDTSYCLLGIFDINMPLLYGEGRKAFVRLQQEIIKQTSDQSIFAWRSRLDASKARTIGLTTLVAKQGIGMLATSIEAFADTKITMVHPLMSSIDDYTITNIGLSIRLHLIPFSMDVYMAKLRCGKANNTAWYVFLRKGKQTDILERVRCDSTDHLLLTDEEVDTYLDCGGIQRSKHMRVVV